MQRDCICAPPPGADVLSPAGTVEGSACTCVARCPLPRDLNEPPRAQHAIWVHEGTNAQVPVMHPQRARAPTGQRGVRARHTIWGGAVFAELFLSCCCSCFHRAAAERCDMICSNGTRGGLSNDAVSEVAIQGGRWDTPKALPINGRRTTIKWITNCCHTPRGRPVTRSASGRAACTVLHLRGPLKRDLRSSARTDDCLCDDPPESRSPRLIFFFCSHSHTTPGQSNNLSFPRPSGRVKWSNTQKRWKYSTPLRELCMSFDRSHPLAALGASEDADLVWVGGCSAKIALQGRRVGASHSANAQARVLGRICVSRARRDET
ncbi:hypothetical protein BC834DRAFT_455484 [Gloeopeniophorella convolvens]|nr:hypothetical protein BC834DRAFT_455484 [Gloeopeniophorella convolvens]